MKQYFLTLSRGKQIAVIVCCVHLFAVFMLFGNHLLTRSKPTRPMVVKTYIPQPKVEKAVAAAPQVAPPKPQPPKPKKVAPKPAPVAKKAAPVAKPREPAPKVIAKSLEKFTAETKETREPALKEIAQSLETLTAETKKTRAPLNIPTKVESKSLPIVESNPTYGEYLISYLQNALDLPEYGDVRVKLEIDRFGRLIDCQVIEAKSAKNAEFLKNRLPDLTFPCLNDFGIMDATETFTITFRNVETH